MLSLILPPSKLKAARALLDWPQTALAHKSKISVGTIRDIERGVKRPHRDETWKAIRAAFEKAGVTFQAGGIGLRP
jgi:DNA-binding XRE family transcriptional regulator